MTSSTTLSLVTRCQRRNCKRARRLSSRPLCGSVRRGDQLKDIFELKSASDLYDKLRWEYRRLKKDPTNSYVAYNFFVTSWHLLEWFFPEDGDKRTEIRDKTLVLQICEHLAVGAKHFLPKNRRQKAVSSTGRYSYFPWNSFPKNWWPRGYFPDALVVSLSEEAAFVLGDEVSVLDLADKVMSFWADFEDKMPGAT